MVRVLLILGILFMSIGPIAHGYLAYKFNAIQSLLPEEERHDEKPQGKIKFELKDQLLHAVAADQQLKDKSTFTASLDHLILLSKGYAGIPLMPPEVN